MRVISDDEQRRYRAKSCLLTTGAAGYLGLVLDKSRSSLTPVVEGCGGARLQLCHNSSPMSRISCVVIPRWRAGGARNAAHGSSTTDCRLLTRARPAEFGR
jgi:hypothetical protein